MSNRKIIIGTRRSKLALLQCYQVIAELQDVSNKSYNELIDSEFKLILTTGDKKQETPEAGQLNKNAWIDKIEEALLNSVIDVAVHSGKDVPKNIAEGTKLIPIGKRSIPFDVFIGKSTNDGRVKFSSLESATIGTSSLRRQLFLRKFSESFDTVDHRGNVPTRISNLDKSSNLNGIILAAAGLMRLNVDIEYEELNQDVIVPSALQGTLVAQIREDDTHMESTLNRVVDDNTKLSFVIEREISEHLGANCNSCVGIYSFIKESELHLVISAISPKDMRQVRLNKSEELSNIDVDRFLSEVKAEEKFEELRDIIA
uniref:Hydroxymethylbilane synthase n=1 Tax=Candidatus Kentrum sp. UNK TaxID=2126344 RepID=A0A451B5U2_9GAMM|nr:MAG: hydroxymethylbilane synthase [Candidatus Kentron sp. UNK]VFK73642.1 MAG: hydroxymethylbilane synthase [Candidatus Kentron sp. UNK]